MIRRTVVPDVIDPSADGSGAAETIGADLPLAEAARRMRALSTPALAVVAGDGTPLGLLGAGELIAALAGGLSDDDGADPRALAAAALMRPVTDTLAPDDSLLDALELMCRRRADCLPVVADGRLLGLVTTARLLAAVEAAVQALYLEVHEVVFGRAAGDPPGSAPQPQPQPQPE
jgi:CBS domain-containing protein